MCIYFKFVVGAIFCVPLLITPNTYARQLVENDGLRATVDQNFICAENVSVYIDAANIAAFQGDRITLQKLLGGTRAALGFECNNIKRIIVVGRVRGEPVYHAFIQEQNNWRLTDEQSKITNSANISAMPSSGNSAPDKNIVTDCDRLAADPHDPQKNTSGVSIETIDVDSAINACMLALENDPENPRLQFQLGRALDIAGEEDAALEFYELADESGYSAASYFIGETFFLSEDGDDEYFDIALTYYKDAADGGYEPANKVITEFSGYFQERTLYIKGMRRGQWLSKFIQGQQVNKNEDNKRYLNGIATQIINECMPPEATKVFDAYKGLVLEEERNFLQFSMNHLFEVRKIIASGKHDSELFIAEHGCSGYLINRLNEQIVKYVTGKEVVISDATGLVKPSVD